MDLFPLVFASGWASGINAYATVLVLGLVGRLAHAGQIPAGFQRTDVLVVMGILAACELLADKIAYLDSTWDAISTVIRPLAGAVIAGLIAGDQGSLTTIALAGVGGATALASHLSKAGLRLAINTSPEPVSNVTASVANDFSLVGVLSLAVYHPALAAGLAGAALVLALVLCALVIRQIRRAWATLRQGGGAGALRALRLSPLEAPAGSRLP